MMTAKQSECSPQTSISAAGLIKHLLSAKQHASGAEEVARIDVQLWAVREAIASIHAPGHRIARAYAVARKFRDSIVELEATLKGLPGVTQDGIVLNRDCQSGHEPQKVQVCLCDKPREIADLGGYAALVERVCGEVFRNLRCMFSSAGDLVTDLVESGEVECVKCHVSSPVVAEPGVGNEGAHNDPSQSSCRCAHLDQCPDFVESVNRVMDERLEATIERLGGQRRKRSAIERAASSDDESTASASSSEAVVS